jgi:mannose-6-phosphate isomerase-like protein (cupin superfamily)
MYRVFTLSEVVERRQQSREPWFEFLSVPALSLGIYSLPVGAEDPQLSHPEDEVYYILSGRALLSVESENRVAEPGAILYVGANTDHHFHSIEDDLTCLVFFASPARSPATK